MGRILPENISYVIENPDRFIITLSVYVVLLQHEVLRKQKEKSQIPELTIAPKANRRLPTA